MRDASICGLGQAAPNPLHQRDEIFPDDLTNRWRHGDDAT